MNEQPLQKLVSSRSKGEVVKKDYHGNDIYTYVAISISSDLDVLKIYSLVLTFMLPNFGNITNDEGILNIYFLFSVIKLQLFSVFAYIL